PDAPNLHRLFSALEEADGDSGLLQFFNEVCVATPELLQRLRAFDHLRSYKTDFTGARKRQFNL
ncbi:MAG: glycosyltransferase family 2 protein, partial [Paracoccaceae bacterium]|nr:glycosyltransferase family 2 protein [Paracoccaceae bacterium]